MSAALPDTVDAWRMVTARRAFEGTLPLASFKRLATSLATLDGDVQFELEFDRDALGIAYIGIKAKGTLTLQCQRTLEAFALPVKIDSRLGLIRREEEEAGLPEGYEALLITDPIIHPADVIEDELILALPVVPLKPGAGSEIVWTSGEEEPEEEEVPVNPFAALAHLKKS